MRSTEHWLASRGCLLNVALLSDGAEFSLLMSMDFDRDERTYDRDGTAGGSSPGEPVSQSPAPRRLPASTVAWGIALGVVLGIVLSVAGFAYFYRGTAELLTYEALETAEERWKRAGPASYNQDLELVGTQAGKIHVEVRGGQVTKMVRNGYEPSQQRTWYYWSVPGQFETIHIDWEAAKHPQEGFGVAPSVKAVIRAEFDPRYGYPRFYQRILLGTGIHVEWRVTRFEVVSA